MEPRSGVQIPWLRVSRNEHLSRFLLVGSASRQYSPEAGLATIARRCNPCAAFPHRRPALGDLDVPRKFRGARIGAYPLCECLHFVLYFAIAYCE